MENHFLDPSMLPDVYALPCDGDCMSPTIPCGAVVAGSKHATPAFGDYVIPWFHPLGVPQGEHQAQIKKLVGRQGPNLFMRDLFLTAFSRYTLRSCSRYTR
jgi:hypothetical protein